jgi:predicted transposase YbfD/YdcC
VTYFIVAIIMAMQTQMQSISIMQIPFDTVEKCKQYIVTDGIGLQNDVMAMYPNASQFSLVCVDKITIDKMVNDMKRNSKGKET